MKYRILMMGLGLIIFTIFYSCKHTNEAEDKADPQKLLVNGLSIKSTSNSKLPYLVVHKDGGCIGIEKNNAGQVTGAVFFGVDHKGFYVKTNAQGLPNMAVFGDLVLVYENYTSNTVDIAVIQANKQIQLFKSVRYSAPSSSITQLSKLSGISSVASDLRTAGIVLSVASCTFSVVAAVITVGTFGPLAAFACGAAILNASIYIAQSNNEALIMSGDAFSYAADAIGCGSGEVGSCVGLGLDIATSIADASESSINSRQTEVNLASSSLKTGSGDIQVTLNWNTKADLDLYVEDPKGNIIYWKTPTSSTGGKLDVDDTDGNGPENIYWPKNAAPNGSYKVSIMYYNGQYNIGQYAQNYGITNYSLLVQSFGKIKTYTGSITFGQTKSVVTFSNTSLPKINLKEEIEYINDNLIKSCER